MRKHLLMLFLGFLLPLGLVQAQSNDADVQQINKTLEKQTKAWNKGDLESFMQGYWKSDKLEFIGSKGIKYGWKNTLKMYQSSYPNKAKMGILKFTILSIKKLSPDAAFVIGKWHLTRKDDTPNGHFSLLWRKINGTWVIVADHSS